MQVTHLAFFEGKYAKVVTVHAKVFALQHVRMVVRMSVRVVKTVVRMDVKRLVVRVVVKAVKVHAHMSANLIALLVVRQVVADYVDNPVMGLVGQAATVRVQEIVEVGVAGAAVGIVQEHVKVVAD